MAGKEGDSRIFAFELKELMLPVAPAESSPGQLDRRPESDLAATLGEMDPQGVFSLRYLFNPDQPGVLRVALLGKIKADAGSSEEEASSLQHFLQATFKSHSFQLLPSVEVASILRPFAIADAVELTRQKVSLKVASWEIKPTGRMGFGSPPGGRMEAKERPGGMVEDVCTVVLPFVRDEEGLFNLCEILQRQRQHYLIDIAFRQAELPEDARRLLEDTVEHLEKYRQDRAVGPMRPVDQRPQDKRGQQLSALLTLRADFLLNWFADLAHQLQAPRNAVWVRIHLASSAKIPNVIITAAGRALSRNVTVQRGQTWGHYMVGGYEHVHYADAKKVANTLNRLDCAASERDPLRHLFNMAGAGEALRLPWPVMRAGQPCFPGMEVRQAPAVEPSERLPKEGIRLGHTFLRDKERPVLLGRDDHRHHVYAIGKTGVGKSSLMLKMILENIRQGDGVAVLDPHGDLIQLLLDRIPSNRCEDVILVAPGSFDHSVGLNLLEWQVEEQRTFVVEEMISMLRVLYAGMSPEIMGPMFERNVRYGMHLLMADRANPGTLVDFQHLFMDRAFHKQWLPKVKDATVRRFWEYDYPKTDYSKDQYGHYIVSKFDRFVSTPTMRRIIGQQRSTFDCDKVINGGKILLVDLAKGRLTDLNSHLLGMIVMAKLYASAMRRAVVSRNQRRDFFVYVDEFQNLATQTFVGLLSEARKFRLNLTLCNQYTHQLPKDIIQALLGNVGTMIAFRVGGPDAELLQPFFSYLRKESLCEQPNHHAYVRLLVEGRMTNPFSLWSELETAETGCREKITERMREYTRPILDVDQEIEQRLAPQGQTKTNPV